MLSKTQVKKQINLTDNSIDKVAYFVEPKPVLKLKSEINLENQTSNFVANNSQWSQENLTHIQAEYELAFRVLRRCPTKRVTFYGGARSPEHGPDFKNTQKLAKELASLGWGIVSGGGTGIMTASLLGAQQAQGLGIGFRMNIVHEITPIRGQIDTLFTEFGPRKMALRSSPVWIFAPGGVGTLDELMENLTLLKTGKLASKTIFLYNQVFWQGQLQWLQKEVLARGLADPDLISCLILTDSVEEIIQKIKSLE